MKDRKDLRSTSLLAVGVSILSLFVWASAVATAAERHSGRVVAVDAATRTLVIDEIGANAKEQRLRLRRSEEHTSELQSRLHLVCRLLLEKKKKKQKQKCDVGTQEKTTTC